MALFLNWKTLSPDSAELSLSPQCLSGILTSSAPKLEGTIAGLA